jgi:hypothetical protein
MARNISFKRTTPQFLDGSKTVTRRDGWHRLKAGTILHAVEKARGLRKEEVVSLGLIRVVSVRRERLADIDQDDVRREGFPDWSPEEFVTFFCDTHKGCTPDSRITRIEFERIDG